MNTYREDHVPYLVPDAADAPGLTRRVDAEHDGGAEVVSVLHIFAQLYIIMHKNRTLIDRSPRSCKRSETLFKSLLFGWLENLVGWL